MALFMYGTLEIIGAITIIAITVVNP